jgi:hypothetical protein
MAHTSALLWVMLLMGVIGSVVAWCPTLRMPRLHKPAWLRTIRIEQQHASDFLALSAREIEPTLHLMHNGVGWMLAAWAKRELWEKDPMHPDLPALVIKERELRP